MVFGGMEERILIERSVEGLVGEKVGEEMGNVEGRGMVGDGVGGKD